MRRSPTCWTRSAPPAADPAGAASAYAEAVARRPDIVEHAAIPGTLPPLLGRDDLVAALERAAGLDPEFAAARAALGNVRLRCGDLAGAVSAYAEAVALDPADAAVRLALAELTNLQGDEAAAQRHFAAAFARARVFSPVNAAPEALHVLVLLRPGPWPQNVPLDFILDRSRFALHKWYLTDAAGDDVATLPAHAAAFVAIGAAEGAAPALALAQAFVAAQRCAPINDPRRIAATARPALAATLAGVPGCTVPAAARVGAAALRALPDATDTVAGIGFPLLVRPVDRHGGRDLARVADAAALRTHVAATAADSYDVSAFVDYRGADGFYRKYRVMFVDGVAFPYHAAVDDDWMIHYHRAPMDRTAWMRDAEARFLADPTTVFPGWPVTMPALAAAIGLDYAGIDCARLDDGSVLVFEADAAMLVHASDPPDRFAYKRPAVARIAAALGDLIERRCNFSGPPRD